MMNANIQFGQKYKPINFARFSSTYYNFHIIHPEIKLCCKL